MRREVRKYLSAIGRRGGRKSRRVLSRSDAQAMVCVREARRAFREFRARCFWSYDPERKITSKDVPWVAAELMKNGGRRGYLIGARLCR